MISRCLAVRGRACVIGPDLVIRNSPLLPRRRGSAPDHLDSGGNFCGENFS
jgi:hypothetical protein